jgi:hypothetical protein
VVFDLAALLDVSHLASFLGGTAVGAAGTYMADRLTDQRRRREAEAAKVSRFKDITRQMPSFIAELRADLNSNSELAIREFVVLPNERVTFNHDHPRFEYHESKHEAATNYVSLLVEADFVEVLRSSSTPIYRLREHFVALVKNDA